MTSPLAPPKPPCSDEFCDHKECWNAAKAAVRERRIADFDKRHPKPVAPPNPELLDEQVVRQVHPDAFCSQHYDGEEPPAVIGYAIYDNGGIGKKLSAIQPAERAAWADARSRLAPLAPESPTTPDFSGESLAPHLRAHGRAVAENPPDDAADLCARFISCYDLDFCPGCGLTPMQHKAPSQPLAGGESK